jgi:starch-binding outer membrane protein, SusD/RagB family
MKRIIKISIISTILAFAVSCDGLLDTEPTVSVSSDVVVTTASGMDAILTSAYDRLSSDNLYRYWIPAGPEVLADNSQLHPLNSGRFATQSENAFGSHFTSSVWSTAYRLINEANIVIHGAGETQTSQSHRDRLMGEAHFLRALGYQDLLRVYSYEPNHPLISQWDQGVILRTSPTLGLSDADLRPRSTVLEGYEQAESDYLAAISFLSNNDRGSVYFADAAAAHAGLARLYLYWERWDDALNHAEEAVSLARGSLTDFSDHDNIFDILPNPESIFELSFDQTHGSSGSLNAVTTPPPGWFDALPSDELMALYEDDDLRNNLYAIHNDDFGVHNYILKYPGTVGQNTDHIPIFRVAEMYLIQAEAMYELNDEAGAIEALETLRAHRGLGSYDVAPSGQALLDEIFDERRRELAFEGHRWFDLKRRALNVPKPEANLNSSVPFDDVRILAPLSSTQVENNPNLDQNPGY